MGGFVKETRSLHPAEGTASLTVEEVWGGDEGPLLVGVGHPALEVPNAGSMWDLGESFGPSNLQLVGRVAGLRLVGK